MSLIVKSMAFFMEKIAMKSTAERTKQPKSKNAKSPIAIDLFSGAGGTTLGLQMAGFSVKGAVEIDSFAAETYRANHPKIHLWQQDILTLPPREARRHLNLKIGELDLLAGCPPCQGFSSVRTLNGSKAVADGRNDLVLTLLDYAEEFIPKAIMMENVPGLKSDLRMESLQKNLKRLGYQVNIDVLDASDFGVPQRRKRLIMIASKIGPIAFSPKSSKVHTVRHTIAQLPNPGESGDPCHDVVERRSTRILKMISQIPHDGGSRKDLENKYRLKCHQHCDGFTDVYGRLKWDSVSPTITSGCTNPSKGRFLHPTQDRAMTPREAAMLQSFPPSYFFSMSRGKESAARMIGNALPPVFIKSHAMQIRKKLKTSAFVLEKEQVVD